MRSNRWRGVWSLIVAATTASLGLGCESDHAPLHEIGGTDVEVDAELESPGSLEGAADTQEGEANGPDSTATADGTQTDDVPRRGDTGEGEPMPDARADTGGEWGDGFESDSEQTGADVHPSDAGEREPGDAHEDEDAQQTNDTGPVEPPGPSPWAEARCGQIPPDGASLAAPPKPYSGGTCPLLVGDGATKNAIQSKGAKREFLVAAPDDIEDGETLPVLFAWHWLKGSGKSFVSQGELIAAAQQQRFVAVIPESKEDITIQIPFVNQSFSFPWPFTSLSPQSRFEEEYVFFDDMLACVAEQFPVDTNCVSVAGVSAGALFGVQLASARSEHIASFVSLSGGIQSATPLVNSFLQKWQAPTHKMPMLVLWGGPTDSCALLNFQAASFALEDALDAKGHFVVECLHNCGHGVPPIEPPPGGSKFTFLWEFFWAHPFWLPPGESPWATGIPEGAPDWCAIGSGEAIMRTGPCDAPGCPL